MAISSFVAHYLFLSTHKAVFPINISTSRRMWWEARSTACIQTCSHKFVSHWSCPEAWPSCEYHLTQAGRRGGELSHLAPPDAQCNWAALTIQSDAQRRVNERKNILKSYKTCRISPDASSVYVFNNYKWSSGAVYLLQGKGASSAILFMQKMCWPFPCRSCF